MEKLCAICRGPLERLWGIFGQAVGALCRGCGGSVEWLWVLSGRVVGALWRVSGAAVEALVRVSGEVVVLSMVLLVVLSLENLTVFLVGPSCLLQGLF